MANVLYAKAIQAMGAGQLDLSTGTFKVVLVDSALYTPNTSDSGHEFLSDIPSGARLSTATLTNVIWSGRTFRADAVNPFPDPGAGKTGEYLIVYKDTGNEATSRLIVFIDTATGLPITGDGVNDAINWSTAGIFIINN